MNPLFSVVDGYIEVKYIIKIQERSEGGGIKNGKPPNHDCDWSIS
jgi:hypothetical protein